MKRLLQGFTITALLLSTTSCGIPQLLGRTANNTAQQVSTFAGAAVDAAY